MMPQPDMVSSLIARAKALVKPNRAFDTCHIVRAALEFPESAGIAGHVLQVRVEAVKRERWLGALKYYLEYHAEPLTFGDRPDDAKTSRLRQCYDAWVQESSLRITPVSNALILWTIMAKDAFTVELMGLYSVDRDLVMRGLEEQFGVVESQTGPHAAVHNMGNLSGFGVAGPNTWQNGPSPWQAAQAAWLYNSQPGVTNPLTPIVLATPGLVYRNLHPVASSHLLTELGKYAQARALPLLVGQDGSPLPLIGNVLADRFASREPFIGAQTPLNWCTGVVPVDIAHLRSLALSGGEHVAANILDAARKHAMTYRCVLMFDHVDALRGNTPPEVKLRAAINTPLGVPSFGVYYAAADGDSSREAAKAFPDATVIPVSKYTATQTHEFIYSVFVPVWEHEHNLTLTADALDSVIALEPGIWVNRRRKTLPYVVLDIVLDALITARGGEPAVRETARQAQVELAKLWEMEWPSTADAIRRRYEGTLHEADIDLKRLVERPKLGMRDGKWALTRAHLTAQLLCPSQSQFHLPGFTPDGPRGR